MDDLSEILEKRSTPGVLIFDFDYQLRYANEEALHVIPGLEESVPLQISDLCRLIRKDITAPGTISGEAHHYGVLADFAGRIYSIRAFPIQARDNPQNPTHIMVLLERITIKHPIDFEQARKGFNLTKREMEVLRLICQGYTNRMIAEKLFVSEYTVKDHIKNIMAKMEVNSRSAMISTLK